MPTVTSLSELTIDGKLSLGAKGSSKDLFEFYGEELRTWFHAQRAQSDAIMVGAGTVRSDDPELTVRYALGPSPLRVVPSSDGLLPPDARLLSDGRPTLVAVSRCASDDAVAALTVRAGVEVVRCGDERVCLVELMRILDRRGVRSLMVEGGASLLHSLFEARLISRIVIKHIPVISGSLDAPTYLHADRPGSNLTLSRWRLIDLFQKSGVGVSIYEPMAGAT